MPTTKIAMHDELIIPGMPESEVLLRRRVKRIAEFYRHLVLYVTCMTLVWVVIIALTDGWTTSLWGGFMMGATFGWALGVLVHGLCVLPSHSILSLDWQEKKYRELLGEQGQEEQ